MSFSAFAKLLGVKRHQAEDALHSEGVARAVLSRRELFAASGALAAGSVFAFPRVTVDAMSLILDINVDVLLGTLRSAAFAMRIPFHIAYMQTEEKARRDLRLELRKNLALVGLAERWRP
jgi:hypothetical protein